MAECVVLASMGEKYVTCVEDAGATEFANYIKKTKKDGGCVARMYYPSKDKGGEDSC